MQLSRQQLVAPIVRKHLLCMLQESLRQLPKVGPALKGRLSWAQQVEEEEAAEDMPSTASLSGVSSGSSCGPHQPLDPAGAAVNAGSPKAQVHCLLTCSGCRMMRRHQGQTSGALLFNTLRACSIHSGLIQLDYSGLAVVCMMHRCK